MQAGPHPQMSRAQKLRWYADQLITEAAGYEQKGENETAISRYLQAVDLLLLLAKVEQNYTAWKSYTDKATFCQQKVRGLMAQVPKA